MYLFTICFGKQLLNLTTSSIEKYLASFWLGLLTSILCPSFSVSISNSPFLCHFFAGIIPLNFPFQEMKHLNPHHVCTLACSMEAVIWGCSGCSQQGFLQYRLPWLQSSHIGTYLPQLQGEWTAVLCLISGSSEEVILLNAHECDAGMGKHRVETMHPAHFTTFCKIILLIKIHLF